MKRAIKEIEQDHRERQEDKLLRAHLRREEANEAARKQKKNEISKYSEKWKAYLEKWDASGFQIASERGLTLPRAIVPGIPTPPFLPLIFTFLVSIFIYFIFFSFRIDFYLYI